MTTIEAAKPRPYTVAELCERFSLTLAFRWNCEASCAIFKPIRSQFAAVRLTQSVCHVKGRRLC